MIFRTTAFTLFFSLRVLCGFSQDAGKPDCSLLKQHCRLRYLSIRDTSAYLVINGDHMIEYHDSGKYYIQSKMTWINDCEYDITLEAITVPHFPYQPGDVMTVRIDKIEDDILYYTSTVNGQSWMGKMKIMH